MYHKNTAYNEKVTTTPESIKRVARGNYTFDDVENIYLNLFKRFIQDPTIKNNEEWYKFQLKYVPFRKQKLSPEFINNINHMLDILIEKRQYQLYNISEIRITSFLSTVIDYDTYVKVLEKNIAFFSSDPRYSENVEKYKKDLASIKLSIEFDHRYEQKTEHKKVNINQATAEEIKTSQTLEEISDTLLDLDSFFKNNFLMKLDQEGVRDIVADR